DSFHAAERPSTLQKAIGRAERTRSSKRDRKPWAVVFERVANEHGTKCEQTEGGQCVHSICFHLVKPTAVMILWSTLIRKTRPKPDRARTESWRLSGAPPASRLLPVRQESWRGRPARAQRRWAKIAI